MQLASTSPSLAAAGVRWAPHSVHSVDRAGEQPAKPWMAGGVASLSYNEVFSIHARAVRVMQDRSSADANVSDLTETGHRMRQLFGVAATVFIIAALLWACGSDSTSTTPTAPSGSTLRSVVVTGTTPSVGSSAQFTATASFSNGTTQDVTSQAAWQSSSPSVAAVSASGL